MYTCPICKHGSQFGGAAAATLHARVSHAGATPIVEVPAYVHTGFEAGAL